MVTFFRDVDAVLGVRGDSLLVPSGVESTVRFPLVIVAR